MNEQAFNLARIPLATM